MRNMARDFRLKRFLHAHSLLVDCVSLMDDVKDAARRLVQGRDKEASLRLKRNWPTMTIWTTSFTEQLVLEQTISEGLSPQIWRDIEH